jgi:hypothetical protein
MKLQKAHHERRVKDPQQYVGRIAPKKGEEPWRLREMGMLRKMMQHVELKRQQTCSTTVSLDIPFETCKPSPGGKDENVMTQQQSPELHTQMRTGPK